MAEETSKGVGSAGNREATHALDLAQAFESQLADLYLRYSGIFPEDRHFWQELAMDERNHARSLSSLSGNRATGACLSAGGGPSAERLRGVVAHLEQTIARAQAGHVTRGRALAVAVGLETDMLEGSVSAVLNPEHPAAAEIRQYLLDETRRHLGMLLERIREVQQLAPVAPAPKEGAPLAEPGTETPTAPAGSWRPNRK